MRKLLALAGDLRQLFRFGLRGGPRRSRHSRLVAIARVAVAERRNVAAARYLDQQRIVAPGSRIVARQRLAQTNRLDPHDRIDLRVEIGAAIERFHRDGVGLSFLLWPINVISTMNERKLVKR